MIRDINISAKSSEEDDYVEPPTRVLNLTVIGGTAFLNICGLDEKQQMTEPVASIDVPARSLLRALAAAIEDD